MRWSPRARVDAALESGQEVSTAYDPMLGKVIVHGSTREAARRALVAALDDTAILGLTTNLGFLRGLAASDEFRDNAIDTAWLDSHPDAIRPEGAETAAVLARLGAGPRAGPGRHPVRHRRRLAARPAPPRRRRSSWSWTARRCCSEVGRDGVSTGSTHPTAARPATGVVHPIASDADVLRLEIDDLVHEGSVRIGPHRVDVAHLGHTFTFPRPDPFGPARRWPASDGTVVAPMPGTVLAVVGRGRPTVEEGDVLGVMEAMKMELSLKAPVAGTVTTVGAAVGDQVALGATCSWSTSSTEEQA